MVARNAGVLTLLLIVLLAGFALGRSRAPRSAASPRTVLYYVDPMHPAYRSSKPGIAPDCGMQLTPVYAEDLSGPASSSGNGSADIAHVNAGTRQIYGIGTAKVEQSSGGSELHAYGRVAADETRIYRVNLGTEGYVKETTNDAVGNHVTKNQHLAVVYSPEFLAVAGGYLSANERTPGTPGKETAAQAQNSAGAQARADRLRNLGMSDAQIDEITESHKIPEDIYVVSPADGFILSRDLSPGLRFEKHAELYRIADLSHVWVLAEVFGRDAQAFRPGAIAHLTLPDTGEHFTARVSSVLPELDPATHTLKPRLELENPGFRLRPNMFVDVDIPAPARAGLTIPAAAIVDTGLSKRVFVEVSDGNFEAREVKTGWTSGDRVQVLQGLRAGDTVVSSGTFLIDSETRMHPLAGKVEPAAFRN